MRAIYDVPAPAKLNLFLHITGRRADGYHLLQSAFMLIDWCDTLHFERRPDGQITREDLGAPLPPDDLIVRAARALQQATGCTQGAHIGVDKRIPAQAGMGGGSSDAASTLMALNRLWNLRLPRAELARIGLTLGADVPFFVHGHHGWVEGVGEQVQPLELPPARFVVVKPPQGLETVAIFRAPDLKRDSEPAILAGFTADPYGFGHNDLQPVAERLCPQVAEAIGRLSHLGLDARMTGSGSAVFAQFHEAKPAPVAAGLQALMNDAPDWQVRLCSNLEHHPLVGWVPGDD
ncbi:4-(cytidine 5'-diphospho)-2-C-methyl-D-erythritol kinase [Ottowia sp.]|uniref:4-(cytidine 5'-diphospho)-2-C-methyl-D-erythritol kinase n=1 Tax=Ottowia sp. TaxID=1898956 RepID=UPI002BB58092|nr:4-(cytidine 5'-diphospho)-2-C-methyl-D-erythritol kinase [Ottowia sp.]HOB67205.1 4-(cytidine 5'-diphospho)-2-C-methyl-D-erythritol kinase [Ottowia sp.]HPZ56782.1 4-(cytidine 5'-diphospho)-2-C-methyl-D-erythritol kinase [Ottowia sp.]HQD47953.1 4-(cytidine 5'-diphospho)-2-C-methyl-D-erythritol kinase [Ottowia sp.]